MHQAGLPSLPAQPRVWARGLSVVILIMRVGSEASYTTRKIKRHKDAPTVSHRYLFLGLDFVVRSPLFTPLAFVPKLASRL